MKNLVRTIMVFSTFMTAGLCLAEQQKSQAGAEVWTIDSRQVPVPFDISIELRQSMVSMPVPDVKAAGQFKPFSENDWRSKKDKVNSARLAHVEKIQKQLPVSVTRDVIDGVVVRYVTPDTINPRHKEHLFVDIHGGAFLLNGGGVSVIESIYIASRLQIPVLSIDYRTLPEHRFPAALDDVVKVYRALLRKRSAQSIILGGTSAGGNLALASVFKFKQLGLALPGALYAGTPWSDLTKTGDTQFTNEGIDRLLVTNDGLLSEAAHLYAGKNNLKNPLISPVYGDFSSFPPTYLVTGTRDLLLSDTARTHRKLREAGVNAELNVYEGMSHADYMYVPDSPESKQIYAELNEFLLRNRR